MDILEYLKAGGPVAIGGLAWWLAGRFRYIEKGYQSAIDSHEAIDQKRHDQNLRALEKIRLVMAQAGIWNGHGSVVEEDEEGRES